jgi:hypothetical protein
METRLALPVALKFLRFTGSLEVKLTKGKLPLIQVCQGMVAPWSLRVSAPKHMLAF